MSHLRSRSNRSALLARVPLILLTLVLALPALTSSATAGPIGFTAFGGIYSGGVDEAFLGAGVRLGLGGLSVTPNFEYLFVDDGSAYTVNADVTFPIVPLGVASVYGGGGLGLLITDPDNFDSETETVVNLIAGAGFNAVPMKPFGQIKYVIVDGEDPFVFMAGIRF